MLGIAGAVIAVYVCLIAVLFFTQRNLMYHPAKGLGRPLDSGVQEMVAVNLQNPDGQKIVSWYKAASTNKPTLIYFHGNAGHIGDRSDKVRAYLDQGYGVVLVGYRGYGDNPGNPTEEGLYADANVALEFLARTGTAPDHWILYGESLGSGVAVEMAYRYAKTSPVAGVVLEAPFTSMVDAAKSHYPLFPVGLLVHDRYDSLSKISKINAPLMVFHGTKDKTVPTKLGKRLFDVATGQKTAHWVEGADHNDLYDHNGAELTIGFMKEIWLKYTS